MPKDVDDVFGPMMPWLAPPFLQLISEIQEFDPRKVATTMARVERGLASVELTPEQVKEFLQAGAAPELWHELKFALDDGVRQLKEAASKDARYSLVLLLMKECHERVPFLSFMVLRWLDPPTLIRRMCEPHDLLVAADRSRGEIRARALVRAFREVAEMLYEPYLRALWALSEFTHGKWPSEPGTFGALVNACHDRFQESHPGLVDPDVGWLRNATAHAHWVYDPSNGTLILWDAKRPPRRISLEHLEQRVLNMYYLAAGTLPATFMLHAVRDVMIPNGLLGLIEEAARAIPNADTARQAEVDRQLDALAAPLFAPLKVFLAAHAHAVQVAPTDG